MIPDNLSIVTTSLPNGMTVLVQPMPWLRTAAFTLSLPAGLNAERDDRGGLASLVGEMVQRGAGNYSSRDLVAVQDNLGIDRHSSVAAGVASFSAAMPADSLRSAIRLYADIARRPHLPGDQLEDARLMAMQELRAVEDEPTQRVMRRLRELHYGAHLGRASQGTMESLQAITQDEVRRFYTENYHAREAILAVAGRCDVRETLDWIAEAFGDWTGKPVRELAASDGRPTYEHLHADSSQTHIGFSFDSIPYGHPEYFRMRAGIGVLSDGMSSRLFDRVREQRGLCYTVGASCHSLPHAAGVFGYAGTTSERAQETLDVTLHEIEHLVDDLQEGELERWKVRIQSSLIMEQESSASRAASLASDYFQLGRVVTTEELESSIESLTLDEIRQYWLSHRPSGYRFVTLGAEALRTPLAVA